MEKVAGEVLQRLDKLAEQFGLTVSELWPEHVNYCWWQGMATIIAVLCFVGSLPVILYGLARVRKHCTKSGIDSLDRQAVLLGAALFLLVALTAVTVAIGVALPMLMSPVGYAVTHLLGQ